jgi:hypothetical protein
MVCVETRALGMVVSSWKGKVMRVGTLWIDERTESRRDHLRRRWSRDRPLFLFVLIALLLSSLLYLGFKVVRDAHAHSGEFHQHCVRNGTGILWCGGIEVRSSVEQPKYPAPAFANGVPVPKLKPWTDDAVEECVAVAVDATVQNSADPEYAHSVIRVLQRFMGDSMEEDCRVSYAASSSPPANGVPVPKLKPWTDDAVEECVQAEVFRMTRDAYSEEPATGWADAEGLTLFVHGDQIEEDCREYIGGTP